MSNKYDGSIFPLMGWDSIDQSEIAAFADLPIDEPCEVEKQRMSDCELYKRCEFIFEQVYEWADSQDAIDCPAYVFGFAKLLLMSTRVVQSQLSLSLLEPAVQPPIQVDEHAVFQLGYAYCKWEVLSMNAERFYAIGQKQHGTKWKSGERITDEAIELIDAGETNRRRLAKQLGVSERVARRWIDERKGK
ncbi:MAG: helix-turn-helix domain-containing protein [Rubripirellula sp.]